LNQLLTSDGKLSKGTVLAILGGTGKEGPGLAMRWAKAGYRVIIGSRQAEKAQVTADEINSLLGTDTVSGMENGEAARSADICILTVVQSAHHAILESLKDDLAGRLLVDATARVEFRNPQPPDPPSAARHAQSLLGTNTTVVAAFQNVPAHTLKNNLDGTLDTDVLVCADDAQAAQTVIELARAGGMRAYYAGSLDNAVVVEGLTSLLISLNKHYGLKNASINITGIDRD